MTESDYFLFHLKVLLGFYRPLPLVAAHVSLSILGGLILERLQQFWGDFALSYALILTTILWFLDTVFTVWISLRDGEFSPGELARSCGKWLLWVSILFVAYSVALLDSNLGFVGKTMEMSVLLTQGLFVVRGAARLLNNPLADQLLKIFQGRLEQRLQEILNDLSTARQQADQAQAEFQQIRLVTEELHAHKSVVEERLSRLEQPPQFYPGKSNEPVH